MTKYTQKNLKDMVARKVAIDLTHCHDSSEVKEPLDQIGYSVGVYGCNGALLQGVETGNLYVIAGRTAALFMFV